MNNPIYLLTFVVALGSGLVAGIFFAFSNFVMKALGCVPPAQGIAAMQSINAVVLNRWFFAVFLAPRCVVWRLPLAHSFAGKNRAPLSAHRQSALFHRHDFSDNCMQCALERCACSGRSLKCRGWSCSDELSEELDHVERCTNHRGACRSSFIYRCNLSRQFIG